MYLQSCCFSCDMHQRTWPWQQCMPCTVIGLRMLAHLCLYAQPCLCWDWLHARQYLRVHNLFSIDNEFIWIVDCNDFFFQMTLWSQIFQLRINFSKISKLDGDIFFIFSASRGAYLLSFIGWERLINQYTRLLWEIRQSSSRANHLPSPSRNPLYTWNKSRVQCLVKDMARKAL